MQGRQHIPTKPHATGIKLYGMADEYFYIYSFWIYKGKKDKNHNAKLHQIVVDFINSFKSTNHIYFCDSYYGSLELAKDLDSQNYKFVLSARVNRPTWLFKDVLHVGLKKSLFI